MDTETPFCQRCKEDFPVADQAGFAMGLLTPIDTITKALWRKLRIQDWESPAGRYFCGNCYFDAMD